MSYKKIIILPALFFLSNFLYISCCKCIDAKDHFYEILNMSVRTHGSGNAIIDTGVGTHVDSVYHTYSMGFNCVASQKNPLSFLVNESLACKCVECGSQGLKSKIISLEISSDSIYNSIPANQSLNSFFYVAFNNATINLDSLKNLVNDGRNKLYGLQIFTKTKPDNNKGHVFTLKIIFADGRQVMSSTRRIYWT